MTLYELSSKIAVSTIQGCLPPAHPTENLQRQLDRFDPTSPPELRGDVPLSAETERKRLLDTFGPWKFIEVFSLPTLFLLSNIYVHLSFSPTLEG